MMKHKDTTMKMMMRALLTVAALFWGGSAFAQTALTSTTLSAAITNANDRTMVIASATGWTASTASAQTTAVIDREVVGIQAVNGTTVTITRGQSPGARATGHASGAAVYFLPPGSPNLSNYDRAGACSTTSGDQTQNAAFAPVINPITGRYFACTSGVWVAQLIGAKGNTITYPTIATGGLPLLIGCGATTGNANCANTASAGTARIYQGQATLASNAAVITFGVAFTSTTTYACVANDVTTRANVVQMVATSSTTATITNTTGASDVIYYICSGY